MADRESPSTLSSLQRLRAYGAHALLLAIVAGECLTAVVLHRSDEELRSALQSGTPKQKVYALFVLTNRDHPQGFDRESVRRLLDSEDPLVREWTMTTNFTRLAPPLAQEAYVESLGSSPEAIRCRLLLDYRVGLMRCMTLSDLKRFLDATADGL